MNNEILEHYKLEIDLANTLRNSTKEERTLLYSSLYNELYSKVPYLHNEPDKKLLIQHLEFRFLNRFISPDICFMEVGSGDCGLSFLVAQKVKQVFCIDVCAEEIKNLDFPENCKSIITDGCSLGVINDFIDLVYSHQLMEHLHPDDAKEQLQNIYNVLKNGGKYICRTPNKIAGPHDVSKYFDKEAKGFHLKEYTHKELKKIFSEVGFKNIKSYIIIKGYSLKVPISFFIFLEAIVNSAPFKIRKNKIIHAIISRLLSINLIAQK